MGTKRHVSSGRLLAALATAVVVAAAIVPAAGAASSGGGGAGAAPAPSSASSQGRKKPRPPARPRRAPRPSPTQPASLDYHVLVTYEGTASGKTIRLRDDPPEDAPRLVGTEETKIEWTLRSPKPVPVSAEAGGAFRLTVDARGKLEHVRTATGYGFCKLPEQNRVVSAIATSQSFVGRLGATVVVTPDGVSLAGPRATGALAVARSGHTVEVRGIDRLRCELRPVAARSPYRPTGCRAPTP
jgi:hypothetical protein